MDLTESWRMNVVELLRYKELGEIKYRCMNFWLFRVLKYILMSCVSRRGSR